MKKVIKGVLLVALLTGLVGVVLYYRSDYFRAWVRRPRFMHACKIEQGLPDSVCLAGVAMKDFADAHRWKK